MAVGWRAEHALQCHKLNIRATQNRPAGLISISASRLRSQLTERESNLDDTVSYTMIGHSNANPSIGTTCVESLMRRLQRSTEHTSFTRFCASSEGRGQRRSNVATFCFGTRLDTVRAWTCSNRSHGEESVVHQKRCKRPWLRAPRLNPRRYQIHNGRSLVSVW